MSASQAKALRSLVEPIATALGCDLDDVIIRRAGKRRVVKIVVDHRSGGLTLDLVAEISRDISHALDDSTVLGNSAYVLEVTSPGVDRPLTLPRHWARAVGRLVLVTPKAGDPIEGRVLAADDVSAELEVDGTATSVSYDDITRAVVQVEFTRADESQTEDDEPTADPEEG
ncbi:MAG: ribosome maturation factor RimP [Actinomycetota bacterium]|nr:ribosome maturation factor RimP [Actinomycetota bacterium]